MKGRQKLRRRLGGGSSLTVKYLRAVYCAKSAINGGEEIRIRICQKHAATLVPKKKKRGRKRSEKRSFSRVVSNRWPALSSHLLFLANFQQFSNLPFPLSLPLFTLPPFFLLSARKGKTEEKRKEQMQYEVPGVN